MKKTVAMPMALVMSAMLIGACGFPDIFYTDDAASGGGGGGGSSATSAGLGGAAGTPTTTIGGQGGVGNMGGDGGAGGMLMCELGNLGITGLCGSTQKCTVLNPATGVVGCNTAGSKPLWQTCSDDSDCVDGSWCDEERKICKPFCKNVDGCAAFDGECVPALQSDGATPIPGNVKTCISMCNPVTGSPCAITLGVTCAFIFNNQFDCAFTDNLVEGQFCLDQAECGAELGCIGNFCSLWCSPVGSANAKCGGSTCGALMPKIFYKGVEHGACP